VIRSPLVWPLLLSVGCASAAEPVPEPPAPARSPERSVPIGHPHPIRVCLLWEGRLREISVSYNTATGDTVVDGMRFSERFPDAGQYAGARRWFIDNEPIPFEGRRYTRYGPPWIMGVRMVRPVGEFDGVLLFADVRSAGPHEVLYVPIRSGCEFQPYQWDLVTGGVRGRR
jgi:hypothetical protein